MAKKEAKIKVVIVEPNKPARIELIENELKTFQKLVGGYIECIKLEDFDIIINEEGKLFELEPNFGIYNGNDYVAGTAIFAGVDHKKGEFKSLNKELIEFIMSTFKDRERV